MTTTYEVWLPASEFENDGPIALANTLEGARIIAEDLARAGHAGLKIVEVTRTEVE